MAGVIVGNLRAITLSTAVTMLVPPEGRDRANGLVGTTNGASFLVTSVISGLLVGLSGMLHVLLVAVAATAVVIVHLAVVRIPERPSSPRPTTARGHTGWTSGGRSPSSPRSRACSA